jgi:hypothetical protein
MAAHPKTGYREDVRQCLHPPLDQHAMPLPHSSPIDLDAVHFNTKTHVGREAMSWGISAAA